MAAGPTIRSLALELGVSPMTVSLALRNSYEVSAATRTRIQRFAQARGYRPDPQIVKLMHHLRTRASVRSTANICALRQDWRRGAMAKGNYFDRLCCGLIGRAESLGYTLSMLSIDDYPASRQLTRVLVSRGIEGILLLPLREGADLSARLDWSLFSTVSVTSTVVAPHFHAVTPNHFDNMILACRRLTESGYRRVGLAMATGWDARVNHRWGGGMAWHNQAAGDTGVVPLLDGKGGLDLDMSALTRWMTKERPDAVVLETLDPSVVERALASLPAARRPAIVTMNWPNRAADLGVDQLPERIGAVAIELLTAMIVRGEKGIPPLANHTMIDGSWVGRR